MMTQFKGKRSMKDIMRNVDPETLTWKRKRANNTVEYATKDGTRYIRLHDTDIITFLPNGDIMLDSGGWQTVTTKDRMNRFLDCGKICQERKIWYLWMKDKKYTYKDGMVIHEDGSVSGAGSADKLKNIQKQIKKYVDGYCNELFSGNLPPPSRADCWHCALVEEHTLRPMGEVFQDKSHIISHFEKEYYVPSLVVNAIRDCGASKAAEHYLAYCFGMTEPRVEWWEVEWWEGVASEQIKKALSRYLHRQLGLAK